MMNGQQNGGVLSLMINEKGQPVLVAAAKGRNVQVIVTLGIVRFLVRFHVRCARG